MSKVVKGIGKAVKKVVDGVKKVAKKVWKSKIGRVLVTAALAYFGVPAIMGAMGQGAAAAGGLSGIEGAIAGVKGAWTGLTTAGEALMSGELGKAGAALKGGMLGPSAAPVTPLAEVTGLESSMPNTISNSWGGGGNFFDPTGLNVPRLGSGLTTGLIAPGLNLPPPPPSTSWWSKLIAPGLDLPPPPPPPSTSWWSKFADNVATSKYTPLVAGQMIAGLGQGIAQRSALNRQEELTKEERERQNRNLRYNPFGG